MSPPVLTKSLKELGISILDREKTFNLTYKIKKNVKGFLNDNYLADIQNVINMLHFDNDSRDIPHLEVCAENHYLLCISQLMILIHKFDLGYGEILNTNISTFGLYNGPTYPPFLCDKSIHENLIDMYGKNYCKDFALFLFWKIKNIYFSDKCYYTRKYQIGQLATLIQVFKAIQWAIDAQTNYIDIVTPNSSVKPAPVDSEKPKTKAKSKSKPKKKTKTKKKNKNK